MKVNIIDILKDWKNESKVNEIIPLNVFPSVGEYIKICTDNRLRLIGTDLGLFNKYKKILKKNYPCLVYIKIVDTSNWYTMALKL